MAAQFWKEFPTRSASFEAVVDLAAMPDPDDFASALSYHTRQRIDAIDDARQVVLGCAIQEPHLHVDDDQCVHHLCLSTQLF